LRIINHYHHYNKWPYVYRVGQKSGNTLVTFERIKVESCN